MTHIPVKLPDTMTRDDVGPYLAELRKHFNLSEQDVSDRLHIRVRYLRAMEIGDFAQLPTVVYARGYLHTYAEFLGLDADQVVERCFGEEPAVAPMPLVAPVSSVRSHMHPFPWRNGAVMAVIIAVVILIGAQFVGRQHDEAPEPVAAVPDEVLEVMRNMFMPTGLTRDCLNDNGWSPCMAATRNWQWVGHAMNPPVRYEGDEPSSALALALILPTTPLAEDAVPAAEVPEKTQKKKEKPKPVTTDEPTEEPAEQAR